MSLIHLHICFILLDGSELSRRELFFILHSERYFSCVCASACCDHEGQCAPDSSSLVCAYSVFFVCFCLFQSAFLCVALATRLASSASRVLQL